MDRPIQRRTPSRSDQVLHHSDCLPGRAGAPSQGGDTGSNTVGAAKWLATEVAYLQRQNCRRPDIASMDHALSRAAEVTVRAAQRQIRGDRATSGRGAAMLACRAVDHLIRLCVNWRRDSDPAASNAWRKYGHQMRCPSGEPPIRSSVRSRTRPLRMRAFAVPSGMPNCPPTARYVSPPR
jgi:hypothetical protein